MYAIGILAVNAATSEACKGFRRSFIENIFSIQSALDKRRESLSRVFSLIDFTKVGSCCKIDFDKRESGLNGMIPPRLAHLSKMKRTLVPLA